MKRLTTEDKMSKYVRGGPPVVTELTGGVTQIVSSSYSSATGVTTYYGFSPRRFRRAVVQAEIGKRGTTVAWCVARWISKLVP